MTAEASVLKIAHCRGCGYLLRGLASNGACPECGKAFDLADPTSWTRHPRRGRMWRIVRWPLAILLLLVLACGSGIGWLYWGWRQEQPAIVWARSSEEMGIFNPVAVRQIGPEWLKARAGRWGWLLERANMLFMTLDQSPEARELPQRLKWLEHVDVNGPGLTEEWIAELATGNELKGLVLDSKAVNDALLTRLGQQKKLVSLSLSGAPEVTDAGLAALAGFPELQRLRITGAQIKGPGLQHLRHVPKLEELNLDGTMVGDDAMTEVAKRAGLRELSLQRTRVTSRGVGELAGLKKLEYLVLRKTQVDDSVVDALAKMAGIKSVWLQDALVSEEGFERLKAALPALAIHW